MRIDARPGAPRPDLPCLWVLLMTLTLLALGGCASNQRVLSRQMMVPFTDEQREAIDKTEAAPYRLQRGDVFAVETLVDTELRQPDVLVLPDGTASLVHIGSMRVAGLSIGELEQRINSTYSRDFRDVNLTVVLKEISGRQVYVLGEVKQPGLHDISSDGIGVLGAVAMAGGFTNWSRQTSIVLLRLTADGYLSRELNLAALRKGQAFDMAAVDLQPYDIIYVNRSRIGDFASFTQNVVASLTQYSRFVLDIRYIENPELYRR